MLKGPTHFGELLILGSSSLEETSLFCEAPYFGKLNISERSLMEEHPH